MLSVVSARQPDKSAFEPIRTLYFAKFEFSSGAVSLLLAPKQLMETKSFDFVHGFLMLERGHWKFNRPSVLLRVSLFLVSTTYRYYYRTVVKSDSTAV